MSNYILILCSEATPRRVRVEKEDGWKKTYFIHLADDQPTFIKVIYNTPFVRGEQVKDLSL